MGLLSQTEARAPRAKPGASGAAKRERSDGRGGTLLTRVRVMLRLRVGVGGWCNKNHYRPLDQGHPHSTYSAGSAGTRP